MIFNLLQILLPNEKVIYFLCPLHCQYYLKILNNAEKNIKKGQAARQSHTETERKTKMTWLTRVTLSVPINTSAMCSIFKK